MGLAEEAGVAPLRRLFLAMQPEMQDQAEETVVLVVQTVEMPRHLLQTLRLALVETEAEVVAAEDLKHQPGQTVAEVLTAETVQTDNLLLNG